jgi:hypothetical protein
MSRDRCERCPELAHHTFRHTFRRHPRSGTLISYGLAVLGSAVEPPPDLRTTVVPLPWGVVAKDGDLGPLKRDGAGAP